MPLRERERERERKKFFCPKKCPKCKFQKTRKKPGGNIVKGSVVDKIWG